LWAHGAGRRIDAGVPTLAPLFLRISGSGLWRLLAVLAGAFAVLSVAGAGSTQAAGEGLVAAYSFDENAGTSVADVSGNGHTGTIAGASWTAGRFGSGLEFDGVDDRIDLPGLGTFYDTGFTLEAWVRKRTTKRDATVLGSWSNGQNGGPMIWVPNTVGRYYQTLNRGTANYLDSGRAPAVGTWEHLATTYDGTTVRFYVDGQQVATRTFTGNVGDSNIWRIGAYGPTAAGFFDGTIDEVRVYNRALTAAEVAADRDESVGDPDLVAPSAPTSFAVTGTTSGSIATGWTAATDNVGVAGYNLYRDGVRIASTPTTGYTYTGLTCETSYGLEVEAFDAAGNVSTRASVSGTSGGCDPSTPPPGLVAAYGFGEGSGTVVGDASGNGRDGTVVGATWTGGRIGPGLSFDGTSGRVDLPPLGTFYDTGFTLEAWVKKRTTKRDVAVLGSWASGSGGGPMIWVSHTTGRYNLTLGTSSVGYLDSGRAPTLAQWQHVAATYDGIVARFYVDGQQVASRPYTANVGDSNLWRVGAYGPGPTGFFAGELDEVRVYGRALGPSEIAYDMTHRAGPPDTTPPTAPTGFVTTGRTPTSIATTWQPSTDDEHVAGYNLYRGGVLVASTEVASYAFTGLTCATSYDLEVEAFDDFDNASPRTSLTAATADCDTTPPSVTVTAPADGANVVGTIDLRAQATDDDAVVGVRFEVGGVPVGAEDTSAPYSIPWDTRSVANGTYVVTAAARDASGNVATSAPVTVNVANGPAPRPGLVAAYALDEGTGSTAGDASGNGRPGTIIGASWAIGRFGRALSFDGVDDRIDLTPLGTFYKSGFTYEAWVKKRTTKPDVAVVGTWVSGQGGGPMVWTDHVAGRYQLTLSAGTANYLDSGRVPTTETWEHVAVTHDGATARFYVDGQQVATRAFAGNVGDSNAWRIGAYGAGPSGFFDGLVDEVRIYDRALSPGEIQEDMAVGVGAPDTTPPTTPGNFAKTGETVSTIATSWTASSDNIAVARYDLYRGGTLVDSRTSTSFTFTGLQCGTAYDLGVEAVDTAGNVSARANLNASTRDCDTTPPSVAVTAPPEGAVVTGSTTISAAASDNDGVAGVQFRVDGSPLGDEDTSPPFQITWNTIAAPDGSHTLTAVARDPSGNSATSAPVTVVVDNPPITAQGLVAAYPFDDGAGNTVADLTANGNHGTASGPSWTIGRFGTALTFDGADDWVTVPDSVSLDVSAGMTVEAWVMPTALGTAWRTVAMKETSGNHVFALYGNRNTQVPTGEANVDGSVVGASGSSQLPLGTWSHLALTFDGSDVRLYVNGTLVGTNDQAGALRTSTGPLRIGGNSIWGEWFRGRIDEMRIYDHALTPAQIAFDMGTPVGPDSNPPDVVSTVPAADESEVGAAKAVKATFDEAMEASSIGAQTFQLRDSSGTLVPATVAFDADKAVATLTPDSALGYGQTYTARVKGGAGGVTDRSGNALAADHVWSFTTEPAPPPVFLVSSPANPFSSYTGEILRAEGLNHFSELDVARLTPSVLAGVDVVVLGDVAVNAAQVSVLSDWVQAGGNLIALSPDPQLAGLLGLTSAGTTLTNGYLLIDTATAAGAGLVDETIQFHGTADRYTLDGATALATLYSTASAATPNPAVTLRSVGGNGGQAAAFTYDLARSVVLTRQGNPAWAGQNRDGVFPIRPNDLFFGAAAGDPQPDWVNVNKIEIPQADEQQRLLANLVLTMSGDRKPLPRFWYLPRGEKAAVVMTGDDHALGGTAGRFDQYRAASPPGCSVAAWACVRATSYIYPNSPLTSSQANAYVADEFEVALHTRISGGCDNWTPDELFERFDTQRDAMATNYPGVPPSVTERTHCVAWSDWASHATVDAAYGVRLDTNYYHYPDTWIGNRPGFMTGSGLVMRFADVDGTTIDVYQAHTHMTDEGGQPYPLTVNSLLDRALGPDGYYGIFTANMHTDDVSSPGSDAIVSSALSRDVPIISAKQALDWVDGRDRSAFRDFAWDGSTLSVTVRVASGANGLQAMLPASSPAGALSALSKAGSPVAYEVKTVKGIDYAVFTVSDGRYAASYGS
jgi:chitodextrinase